MKIRMGCFELLLFGWFVIPLYLLFKSLEGLVRLFLAAMSALDRHNRRRAVRRTGKHYREVAHAEARARLSQQPWTLQQPWQYGTPEPRDEYTPWRPGERPGWRSAEPQDNPRWQSGATT